MGKKNQLYFKWIRILPNPDNPKEYYLVFQKDKEMDRKYIRQFDNMFAGKDVLVTLTLLIRGKNKKLLTEEPEEESKPDKRRKELEEVKEYSESPFWSVEE